MAFQYRFYHTCGHFGLGPIIHNTTFQAQPSDPSPSDANPGPIPRTIQTTITFACSFCSEQPPDINDGEGILGILSSSTTSPSPDTWHIIRVCAQEDIKSAEWSLAHQPGGIYRHMACIPKPCGEVEVIGGEEEMMRNGRVERGVTTLVSCSWRKGRGEPFRSRFAGLMSQMDAALLSGEHAER